MTDRKRELLDEERVDDVSNDDFVLEDARRLPGEEIDPDSVRPVPPVDEEGEVVDPVIDDPSGKDL
jgi:hypothetical protein